VRQRGEEGAVKRLRAALVLGLAGVITTAVVAANGTAAPSRQAAAPSPGTISVLYSESYEFDAKNLTDMFWSRIKKEFEAAYPGSKLNLIPVGGTDFDEQKKAALLLRSPSTSPDVVSLETPSVGALAESNYLLSLNKYTAADKSFWPGMPKPIKQMSTFNGNVYSINSGNNVSMLFYNKAMLKKAGIAMPWKPKTWNDILAAARKVKTADPGVIPMWLHAGASIGPFVGLVQTSGNLIDGSTTPMMLDPKTHKWVVDSPGLRATLNFYKTVYGEGLGPPSGDLFGPTAAIQPPDLMRKHKLAIVLGSNWYPGQWVFKFADPWPTANKEVGVAPVPTQNGQAPGKATTIAGWSWAIARTSKHPDLAWDLIEIMQKSKNMIDHANWAGFVPPVTKVAASPTFAKFAPPQGEFANYATFATPIPSDPGFPVYGRALGDATGKLAQSPSTSVDDAIKIIESDMNNELGSSKTETIK
jgi:multiple sugar transport system substrate-binding protein